MWWNKKEVVKEKTKEERREEMYNIEKQDKLRLERKNLIFEINKHRIVNLKLGEYIEYLVNKSAEYDQSYWYNLVENYINDPDRLKNDLDLIEDKELYWFLKKIKEFLEGK